jgi:hypothetical protein
VKESGFSVLKRTNAFNFLKWGEYMKRAQAAERKVNKLKQLLLLTDPVVSKIQVSELQHIQWSEYLKEFPEELALIEHEK